MAYQLSPYARSYRLASGQRSGRAASPTLSNIYEYRNVTRHTSRRNSCGTAPSSPVSLMSIGRSLQEYRSEHNGSMTSFRPLPSPGPGLNRYQPPRHACFPMNMTPSSYMRQRQRLGSSTSLESGPASPTDSIVPFYYDYSESFHGVDAFGRSPAEHPSIPEVSIAQEAGTPHHDPQNAQARSPFGTMPGSIFSPAELPTKHNRRASEQSIRSGHGRRASDKSSLSVRLSGQVIEEHPVHEQEQCVESDTRETQVCCPCPW